MYAVCFDDNCKEVYVIKGDTESLLRLKSDADKKGVMADIRYGEPCNKFDAIIEAMNTEKYQVGWRYAEERNDESMHHNFTEREYQQLDYVVGTNIEMKCSPPANGYIKVGGGINSRSLFSAKELENGVLININDEPLCRITFESPESNNLMLLVDDVNIGSFLVNSIESSCDFDVVNAYEFLSPTEQLNRALAVNRAKTVQKDLCSFLGENIRIDERTLRYQALNALENKCQERFFDFEHDSAFDFEFPAEAESDIFFLNIHCGEKKHRYECTKESLMSHVQSNFLSVTSGEIYQRCIPESLTLLYDELFDKSEGEIND